MQTTTNVSLLILICQYRTKQWQLMAIILMKFSTVPGQSALVSLYLSKQKYVKVNNLRLARYIIFRRSIREQTLMHTFKVTLLLYFSLMRGINGS